MVFQARISRRGSVQVSTPAIQNGGNEESTTLLSSQLIARRATRNASRVYICVRVREKMQRKGGGSSDLLSSAT